MNEPIVSYQQRNRGSVCMIGRTSIAGTRQIASIQERAFSMRRGEPLELVRDSRNPYDRWAVEVRDLHGSRLGYVSCEHNEVVARLIDGGRHLHGRLVEVEQCGSWTRMEMEVHLND